VLLLYKLAARLRSLNPFFEPKKRKLKIKKPEENLEKTEKIASHDEFSCPKSLLKKEENPLQSELKKQQSLETRRKKRTEKNSETEIFFNKIGSTWMNSANVSDEIFHMNKIELQKFALISFDEKPGVQAIATTAPDLPPIAHKYKCHARDHEYKRLGTVDILAGIDLVTGQVHASFSHTHKSSDYIAWLEKLNLFYPKDLKIVILLDNLGTHISEESKQWIQSKMGRFEFVFTPKHASWLNEIENFFSAMARSVLRGIRVKNMQEMKDRLTDYIALRNEKPSIYEWNYGLD
jgi:transposase